MSNLEYGEKYRETYIFDVTDVLDKLAIGSTAAGSLTNYINVVKKLVLVGYESVAKSKGNVYVASGFLFLGVATAIARKIYEDELEDDKIHITYELEYKKRTTRRQGKLYTWGQWTLVDIDFYIETE